MSLTSPTQQIHIISSPTFNTDLRSQAVVQSAGGRFSSAPHITAWDGLEVEVADPVDNVKKQEGGGEENPGVRIQLTDVDVDPSFPPAAFFTLLIAAEEALAVLPVQALMQAIVIIVMPEQGVAHGHHRPRGGTYVERWVGLKDKTEGDVW